MYLKKYGKLIAGIALLLLCALPAGVLAAGTSAWVSALLAKEINLQFDGQSEALPAGYSVLLYKNRTYVPSRFVAERLGASVVWDQDTKTVRINTKPCAECHALYHEKQALNKAVQEQEEKIKALEEKIKKLEQETGKDEPRVEGQPAGNYQRLPQSRTLPDYNIKATGLFKDDHYTRVYLELENKKEVPLQLQQFKTKATVDGEVYKASDILHFTFDQRWYHDIDHEEIEEGYVMLPRLPEDAGEMFLELTILYNDAKQKTETIEFYIELEP